jgi:hypothetical protein
MTAILFRPSGRSQDQTIKMLKKEEEDQTIKGPHVQNAGFFLFLYKTQEKITKTNKREKVYKVRCPSMSFSSLSMYTRGN